MRRGRGVDPERKAQFLAKVQQGRAQQPAGYREQALALFPHVCGRCGREFSGKTLRELTVHHKDHDHMNNPADGSNWELLCLYCHDDEHQDSMAREGGNATHGLTASPTLGFEAFAGLKDLLPKSDSDPKG